MAATAFTNGSESPRAAKSAAKAAAAAWMISLSERPCRGRSADSPSRDGARPASASRPPCPAPGAAAAAGVPRRRGCRLGLGLVVEREEGIRSSLRGLPQ